MKDARAFWAVMAAAVAAGCSTSVIPSVGPSGPQAKSQRTVSAFDGIVLEGAADVDWKPGKNLSVVVEGDRDSVGKTTTTVENGSLVVSQQPNTRLVGKVVVHVASPPIKRFDLRGAGNITVVGLTVDRLDLALGGAGNLKISGRADTLEVALSGSGNMQLANLEAKKVTVKLSGAGNAEVFASESLDASVSGVGNVTYLGNPKAVAQSVTGAGSISPHE